MQAPLAVPRRGYLRALDPPAPASFSARALLLACRPRQWTKNVLVLAAPCAAGLIDQPLVVLQVLGAFVVLCMLSSATYLVNDVRDRAQDSAHPVKRTRPVAAGLLSTQAAVRAAAVLAVVGILAASAIRPVFGVVALGYLTLTMSYSLWWRNLVVADMLAIAAGFVMRAAAGGAATDIYLSRWFMIVTGSFAVFLVAAKRYAELREQNGQVPMRATLRRYSPGGLLAVLIAAATIGLTGYAAWALTRPTHVAWYTLSMLPLVLCIARYSVLVSAGSGQAPEELILRDRMLLTLGLAWCALFITGVYAGS